MAPEDALPLADSGVPKPTSIASRPWLRKTVLTAVGLGLCLGGGAAALRLEQQRGVRTAAEVVTEPPPPAGVVALGRLQPRGGVVEVAAPTSAAAPRVLEVLVEEDEQVTQGQALFVLDTCPQLEAAEAAAASSVVVAEAVLAQTQRDVKSGRKESRATLEAARIAAEQAERDRKRQAMLQASGAIPVAEFEGTEASASQAAAEHRRAQAAARRYDDPADVRLAAAQLDAAEVDWQRARVELETCTVRAPSAGIVLSIDVQAGERASTGVLLRLADLQHMEAELEVFQESIARVGIGDGVRLESEVQGAEPLWGRVRWVGREVGRQSLTSTDPAANTDARVVQVRVQLDEASIPLAARFVGLEVIAHIDSEARS